jgi:hypothetical protein
MFGFKPCEVCGKLPSQHHHRNGNPIDNRIENIAFLCPKHHVHADRLDLLRKIAREGGISSVKLSKRGVDGRFQKRVGVKKERLARGSCGR